MTCMPSALLSQLCDIRSSNCGTDAARPSSFVLWHLVTLHCIFSQQAKVAVQTVKGRTDELTALALRELTWDPNLADVSDDDGDAAMDADSDADEEAMSDFDDDVSDDEDFSWKVRLQLLYSHCSCALCRHVAESCCDR